MSREDRLARLLLEGMISGRIYHRELRKLQQFRELQERQDRARVRLRFALKRAYRNACRWERKHGLPVTLPSISPDGRLIYWDFTRNETRLW